MTARMVAVKPSTMAPEGGRGDKRFRVVKGAPQVILELVQAEQADAPIATGRSWHNPILVKAAK